ncbi:hypothetical protein HU830_05500 [Lactobacillus sp. DCY120]|uniref:Uncharacterized protein n=1 Tax=Bombilactobacillus apium TaxID=2675299 RepID=A0A850RBC5_9LACO|nr:hypothetical protein [Bombilactobacillus apium]NVY96616.1 hypothetical protein [Bombilactobacillus apium]
MLIWLIVAALILFILLIGASLIIISLINKNVLSKISSEQLQFKMDAKGYPRIIHNLRIIRRVFLAIYIGGWIICYLTKYWLGLPLLFAGMGIYLIIFSLYVIGVCQKETQQVRRQSWARKIIILLQVIIFLIALSGSVFSFGTAYLIYENV